MKILHLLYESEGDYFGIGGVGIRAYEIYRRLRDRNEVTLLCKKYPGYEDGDKEGLRHIHVGAVSKSLTRTLLSYAFHASLFVTRHGDEFDVIVEEFSPGVPTFLHLFTDRPLVLQVQGFTGIRYFEKYNVFSSGVLYLFERFRPLCYKNYVVVSDYTIGRYHLNARKRNIALIPNGIPEELLDGEPEDSDYILFLGRIDIHHKGLDILLRAYEEFSDSFPHIRLIIAGDGRDREKFGGIVRGCSEGTRQRIEVSGWVHGRQKADLLKGALMVVMPSRYETQGIVALEAMAAGKAIVASDIPELKYITDHGAGLSFPAGNARALAEAMKSLAKSVERGDMGLKGREWVRAHTWDRVALQYEGFLRQVL